MSKKQLTPGLLAALASGASLSAELGAGHEEHDAALNAVETDEAKAIRLSAEVAAAASNGAVTETDEVKAARLAAEASATLAAAAVIKPGVVELPESSLLTHLKTELVTERSNSLALTLQLNTLTSEAAVLKADMPSLLSIVREATARLCIPLNVTPVALETLSAASLCDYFTKLNTEFKTKFNIGATARTGAEVDNDGAGTVARTAPISGVQMAATRAASGTKPSGK